MAESPRTQQPADDDCGPAQPFCPRCGAEVEVTDLACPSCGLALVGG